MAGIPDADTLTRQPRQPSLGTIQTIEPEKQISPEEALAEAREALAAERARADGEARQRQEENAARRAAEARAAQADQTVMSSHDRALTSGIQAATTSIERAKSDLVSAINNADPVAQAEANARMSIASAELAQLNGQKAYFDNERARLAEEAKRAPPQQGHDGGLEVDTPGGRIRVQPQAKGWMDDHPKFYTDRSYYNAAVAAHSTIVAEGIQEGTPAYFRAMTEEMKTYDQYDAFKRGEQQVPDNLSQRQQQRRQPASSFGAPVSRQSEPRNNSRQPSADQVARQIGPGINEGDLRDAAKWAGYERGKFYNGKRFDSDETAFQQYLADQAEINSIERMGGDTGMKRDQNFRWE